MSKYIATARRLPDGRINVVITNTKPQCSGDRTTYSYTRVGNIDGSNHFMLDGGGWDFLPHGNRDFCEAIFAAERALAADDQREAA